MSVNMRKKEINSTNHNNCTGLTQGLNYTSTQQTSTYTNSQTRRRRFILSMKNLVYKCKRELIEIYKHSLEAIKPERIVKNCIAFERNSLIIKEPLNNNKTSECHDDVVVVRDLNKTRLHVIGGGKCALAMAQGIADVAQQAQVTGLFSYGCLSVPILSKSTFDNDNQHAKHLLSSIGIECKFGSKNNLPDESSIEATQFMLQQIAKACQIDHSDGYRSLFIVLLSGGGSACLTSPKYINLKQKTTLIRNLVQKGANIVELNTVRRCFSNIKGGNLARKILNLNPKAQVISLIISDVINDPIEFIASGPTFLGNTSANIQLKSGREELTKVMHKYGLEIPEEFVTGEESSSSLASDETFGNYSVINKVIGSNKLALESVLKKAQQLDYRVKLLGNNFSGNTGEIMHKLVAAAAANTSDNDNDHKILIVCGGEATVTKMPNESWGLGGRTQEMALDYMIYKLETPTPVAEFSNIVDVFLAGSTDGQDGPTDVAASLASSADWSLAKTFDLEMARGAKKSHDSYNFWTQHKPNWLIETGPTGTNVMDLYFLSMVRCAQSDSQSD